MRSIFVESDPLDDLIRKAGVRARLFLDFLVSRKEITPLALAA